MENRQTDLFGTTTKTPESSSSSRPLAYKIRPENLADYIGQEEIFSKYKYLKSPNIPSLLLWGPPGTGKTTLAYILAGRSNKELYKFNAVLGGVNDLKKLIKSALEIKAQGLSKDPLIFIDEIHRFNKAQQDALLPYIEAGDFTLIGATTENPRSCVNRALLSRMQSIKLKRHTPDGIYYILERACTKISREMSQEILELIADFSNGDARVALNILEIVIKEEEQTNSSLSLKEIKKLILENVRDYDKNNDRHYDVISAFIKSMRGSDPNAALLWLAIMLDGGEDPVFIARRLIIFASEDVGNADPTALQLASAGLTAVQSIGMPEARINLAQVTTYLASTEKSNAAYNGINEALSFIREQDTIQVPFHLRNHPPEEYKGQYLYPHSYPEHFVKQQYTSEQIPEFYSPTEMGKEKKLKHRLEKLWTN